MPKYLELKGQRLVCNDTMPLGLMMDLAEAMVDNENEMKAMAVMGKTLRTMVTEAGRPALEKMLYSTKDPVTFDDLNSALGKLIPEYTQRPTAPPSPSAPSPAASGGTSRRVSLSVVEPDPTPTSSKGGRRAAS